MHKGVKASEMYQSSRDVSKIQKLQSNMRNEFKKAVIQYGDYSQQQYILFLKITDNKF